MIYMRHDVYIKKINYFRVLGTISLVRKLFVLLMVLLICFFLHKSFGIFSFFVLFSVINTPLIHLLLNREAFLITFYGICRVFFFQAEDGIRDAQEARGLGDVYKRQEKEGHVWN